MASDGASRVAFPLGGLSLLLVLASCATSHLAQDSRQLLPIRTPGQAPTFEAPRRLGSVQILLDRRFTGFRDASMQLLRAEPGMKLPRHRHARSHELLYILSGRGTMFVIDPTTGARKTYLVRKGMAIWIPRGVEHGMSMLGQREPLRALQLYTPAGPEQRFRRWKKVP
ncbi:MAG: cupin domain-containing protein [Myxococcales bacterium]|nr:cupin domain-containing protein [Myxococcales bacterium]